MLLKIIKLNEDSNTAKQGKSREKPQQQNSHDIIVGGVKTKDVHDRPAVFIDKLQNMSSFSILQ